MSNISEKNIVKKINKMSFEDSMTRLEEISQILSSQKNNKIVENPFLTAT